MVHSVTLDSEIRSLLKRAIVSPRDIRAASSHKRSRLLLPRRYRVKVAGHNNRCNAAAAAGGRWPHRNHVAYVKQRERMKNKESNALPRYGLSSRRFDETPSTPTSSFHALRCFVNFVTNNSTSLSFFIQVAPCLSSGCYLRLRMVVFWSSTFL